MEINYTLADDILTRLSTLRCDLIAVKGAEEEIRKKIKKSVRELNEVYAGKNKKTFNHK